MTNAEQSSTNTFIVLWVNHILETLGKFSLFRLAEKLFSPSFGLVERWVIGCFGLAIVCFVVSLVVTSAALQIIFSMLFVVRVLEYLPYVLRVTIFTEGRKSSADIFIPQRTVILLMFNYVEMIFWFAMCYSILEANKFLQFSSPVTSRGIALLRESVMLMVANWSGTLDHLSFIAWATVCFQDFFGLLLTIIVATRFISFLPMPNSSTGDTCQF